MHEEITFHTADGLSLGGTWTSPAVPTAVVLLAGATATPHRYYRRFAAYAAERGLAVLTFDYRGIGSSRHGPLRGDPATMRQWAERDLSAALALATEKAAGLPVLWLGHSFGGQAVGLTPGAEHVAGVVTVGAQLGWYGHWPAPARWRLWATWKLAVPLFGVTHGYLPGWTGVGEDLPREVAAEWARWCGSPRYLLDHVPGARQVFASFPAPVHVIGATDDPFAPLPAVHAYHDLFPSAELEIWRPSAYDLRRIGHFGFFKRECAALWPLLVDRLVGIQREERGVA